MPGQVGTPTMHLAEVPGDTCQKFTSPKLGEMDQIDAFQSKSVSKESVLWWWQFVLAWVQRISFLWPLQISADRLNEPHP